MIGLLRLDQLIHQKNVKNMIKLHENPTHFVQVVENALNTVYGDEIRWNKIYDF